MVKRRRDTNGLKEYTIKKLLDVSADKCFVSVQWEGYKKSTWEPMENIPISMVNSFLRKTSPKFFTDCHGVYLVDKVLAKKGEMYLIQWMDPNIETSWEHESSLTPDLIHEWNTGEVATLSTPLKVLEGLYPDEKISGRTLSKKMEIVRPLAAVMTRGLHSD